MGRIKKIFADNYIPKSVSIFIIRVQYILTVFSPPDFLTLNE